MLDAHTEANVRAAQHGHGLPPTERQTPYRNLRHLLSLQATVTPDKTLLVDYDGDGQREETSTAAFNARVHQAAGFLYDDVGVRRGDCVATLVAGSVDALVIAYACWLVGAAVAPLDADIDDASLAAALHESTASVWLVGGDATARAERIVANGTPELRQIVQVGGTPRPDRLHFEDEIANRPDTFMSADEAAELDDAALRVGGVVLSQYNLLVGAHGVAHANAITGNQRLLSALPLTDAHGLVMTALLPLVCGGSVVSDAAFSPAQFWRRIAADRVQVASLRPAQLQALVDFANEQAANGGSVWGDGIGRHHLRHFRHVLCARRGLAAALVRAFEHHFALPVLSGYAQDATSGLCSCLPLDLRWDDRRHWLLDFETPSVGCAVGPNELAVLDDAGHRLGPGERGALCLRGHNVTSSGDAEAFAFGWRRTGDTGLYEVDARGRAFFFAD